MDRKPVILSIESATLACSVALLQGEEVIAHRHEVDTTYIHAERLLPLIDDMLFDTKVAREDLNAVIVSSGPGSYTGLRIGVATAKGLCHALHIPFIAMDTLESLAYQASRLSPAPWDAVVCVLDARRDEVYTATFEPNGNIWTKGSATRALVLDPNIPLDPLFPLAAQHKNVVVIGDAAIKTQNLLGESASHWTFIQATPCARDAGACAAQKHAAGEFEDIAYFEPRYLKEFIAGVPRDPLGLRKRAIDNPAKA